MFDNIKHYESLNDAAEFTYGVLAKGDIKIWYQKNETRRAWYCGGIKRADLNKKDLAETHILLGEIKGSYDEDNNYNNKPEFLSEEDQCEMIYMMLQGEAWSRFGEARALIQRLGLSHTSMDVGDVIQIQEKYWIVEPCGFKLL